MGGHGEEQGVRNTLVESLGDFENDNGPVMGTIRLVMNSNYDQWA